MIHIVVGCHDSRGCLTCHNKGICNSFGYCECAAGYTGKTCATCKFYLYWIP